MSAEGKQTVRKSLGWVGYCDATVCEMYEHGGHICRVCMARCLGVGLRSDDLGFHGTIVRPAVATLGF